LLPLPPLLSSFIQNNNEDNNNVTNYNIRLKPNNIHVNPDLLTNFFNRFKYHKNFVNDLKINKSIVNENDNIGIIKGHGSTIKNRICLVPSNLNLFIPINKGHVYAHIPNNAVYNYLRNQTKRPTFIQSETNGFIVYGNTPILDMLINFEPYYSIEGNTNHTKSYSFIGIITQALSFLSKSDSMVKELDTKTKINQKFLNKIREETTRDYNKDLIDINDLYLKPLFLSEILNIISLYKQHIDAKIPSTYILISCRGYSKINDNNNIPQISTITRQLSNTDDYRYTYINFTKNIDDILNTDILSFTGKLLNFIKISDTLKKYQDELKKSNKLSCKSNETIKKNIKKIESKINKYRKDLIDKKELYETITKNLLFFKENKILHKNNFNLLYFYLFNPKEVKLFFNINKEKFKNITNNIKTTISYHNTIKRIKKTINKLSISKSSVFI